MFVNSFYNNLKFIGSAYFTDFFAKNIEKSKGEILMNISNEEYGELTKRDRKSVV